MPIGRRPSPPLPRVKFLQSLHTQRYEHGLCQMPTIVNPELSFGWGHPFRLPRETVFLGFGGRDSGHGEIENDGEVSGGGGTHKAEWEKCPCRPFRIRQKVPLRQRCRYGKGLAIFLRRADFHPGFYRGNRVKMSLGRASCVTAHQEYFVISISVIPLIPDASHRAIV